MQNRTETRTEAVGSAGRARTRRPVAVIWTRWGLLATSACFHPIYDRPACGPDGACPPGLTCNAQQICDGETTMRDAPPSNDSSSSDAATDCFGHWFDGSLTIATPQPMVNQSSIVHRAGHPVGGPTS